MRFRKTALYNNNENIFTAISSKFITRNSIIAAVKRGDTNIENTLTNPIERYSRAILSHFRITSTFQCNLFQQKYFDKQIGHLVTEGIPVGNYV